MAQTAIRPHSTDNQRGGGVPNTERKALELVMRAMQEARRRAEARGLESAEINREEDDDDSIYWDDFRSVLREIKGMKVH
jgi:hypothetical protein